MKRKLLLLLAGMILTVTMHSCQGIQYTTFDGLRNLKKGMSSIDAANECQFEKAFEYPVVYNGITYSAKHYLVQIGYYAVTTTSGYDARTGARTTSTIQVPQTVYYLLLFKDDRLMHWGMVNEYAKSEDETMKAMSAVIRTSYDKAMKEKQGK